MDAPASGKKGSKGGSCKIVILAREWTFTDRGATSSARISCSSSRSCCTEMTLQHSHTLTLAYLDRKAAVDGLFQPPVRLLKIFLNIANLLLSYG